MRFITPFTLLLCITFHLHPAAPYQPAPAQVVMDTVAADIETACICCGKILKSCYKEIVLCCHEAENIFCGHQADPFHRLVARGATGAICLSCCASIVQDSYNYHCLQCINTSCPALPGAAQCACITYCCCRFCIKPGLCARVGDLCHRLGDWFDGEGD
ncbi:hypothetical protein FJ365_00070 [Candidatus Dependentiae bacterium]|nr:hypothetical protein [Candidatus Dependentiae bacterium]